MADVAFLTALVILFLGGPVLAVYWVAKDVAQSRTRGSELRDERDDLRTLGQALEVLVEGLLQSNDLAWFNARVSDGLDQYMRTASTVRAKGSGRMLMEAKGGGMGENSRKVLQQNAPLRKRTYSHLKRLVRGLKSGACDQILEDTGLLLGLFLCEVNPPESEGTGHESDASQILTQALAKSSRLLRAGQPLGAEDTIKAALKEIAAGCSSEEAGVPLLILKWAAIRLWTINDVTYRTSKPLPTVIKGVQKQFASASKAYCSGDTARVADVVFSTV